VSGYQSFAVIGNANTTYYTIVHQTASEWEVGIGTYTSAGTLLSRDTVLSSSNGGSLVNFSAGTKFVFCDYPAGRAVYLDTATNVTIPGLTLSGGTANGVLYLNGSKVATSGTALVFDGTNLGIGTASPGSKLDVSGEIRIYPSSSPAILRFGVSATEKGKLSVDTSSNMAFETAGTERMRLDSSGRLLVGQTGALNNGTIDVLGTGRQAIVARVTDNVNSLFQGFNSSVVATFQVDGSGNGYFAGNLGIGTSSPGAKLDVVTGTARWRITNDGSGNIVNEVLDSTGAAYRDYKLYGLNLISYTSGVERMRLDSSGNLGIGTSTPTGIIEMATNASSDAYLTSYNSSSAGTSAAYTVRRARGTAASPSAVLSGDALGGLFSRGYKATAFSGNVGVIRFEAAENWTDIANGTNITFAATPIGATSRTEYMRLDSSGNLGIGTSSPASKLHVSNTAAATRITITDDVAAGRSGYIESNFSDALVIGTTSGVRGIRFSPDNTPRMLLDTLGNLGINNTSPSSIGKLVIQVDGTTTPTNGSNVGPSSVNLYAAGNGGSTNCTIGIFGWQAGNAGIGSGIGFTRESTNDWGTQIRFYTHPTTTTNIGDITERARITSGGYLGIGGIPVAPLHILTPTKSLSLASPASGGGGASYILMGNNDSGGTAGPSIIASSNRIIQFGVGNSFSSDSGGTFTEYARITAAGELLVGRTGTDGFTSASTYISKGLSVDWGEDRYIGMPYVTGSEYFNGMLLDASERETNIQAKASDGTSKITFSTGSTPSERARFNATGAFVFAGGTTTADGIGITFPATQSASSNANTLDDYEEGTWTPTILFGGANTSATYTFQVGTYTKIGNVVYYQAYVQESTASTSSGSLTVGGLPFTSRNTSNLYMVGAAALDNAAVNIDQPVTQMLNNATEVRIASGTNTNNWNILDQTVRGASFRVYISGFYYT
jgi:hypothetical protein